jgi:hypothetical protein
MLLKAMQFLAVILTALALVPGGAHVFALPNKIALPQEPYFTVQGIYRGWALFGFVLAGALLADLALAVLQRYQRAPFRLALLAFVLMAASLAVFFTWTYPANQATANWTVAPQNWQALRRQWELAHATGAMLQFLSLCSIVLSVLSWRR